MKNFKTIKPFFALLLFVCLTMSVQTVASPITWQRAQQNAIVFLQQHGRTLAAPSLRYALTANESAYYVFNIGDQQGYVIASGDDCAPAILGYSNTGSVDLGSMPEGMRCWLDGYARQIQFARKNGLSASRGAIKSPALPPVSPLLTTRWDQTYPYNIYCPLDSLGRHYVTGCVATAMAQVMYYHHLNSVTNTTHEIPSYITKEGVSVEAVPAGSFIDWDHMVDSYWDTTKVTNEQIDAVANLMKYCGTSVQMEYSIGSSGAHVPCVPQALIAYFNYGSRTECLARDDCGLSDEEWENLVYDELSNSRPVLYSGWRDNGIGHAFVCDGYDGDGFFHIVWGWANTNGYYRLTAIDSVGTSVMGFSHSQEAVFHAEPRSNLPVSDAGLQFADPLAKASCLQSADVNDDGVISMEEVSSVTELKSFYCSKMYSFDEFRYFTGVTSIAPRLFMGCENLTSIILPESVTTIGNNVFDYCASLTELEIPSSVVSVGNQAFSGCSNLKHFIWNPKNCPPTVLSIVPNHTERVTVGDSVEVIPNNFAKGTKIKYLTIGKSVDKINSNAFYQCAGLKKVVIPDAVTSINQGAFYEDTGLKELTLGKALTNIGDRAFGMCSSLKSVSIPESVTRISMYAFFKCTELRSVVIGSSVAKINSYAFSGCDSLRMVTCLVPEPISINANVFNNLYGQATLRVPAHAVEAYQATSPWNQFSRIIPIDPTDGDVDLDGRTTIDDLTTLIDQILQDVATDYSDVNNDGTVSIEDVTALIDRLLNGN